MSTGERPTSDVYVFNLYPAAQAQPIDSAQYYYADDPVIALESSEPTLRVATQLADLRGLALAAPELGLSVDVAYRAYIVHRLKSNIVQPAADRAPLGNLPAAAISARQRQEHMRQAASSLEQLRAGAAEQQRQTLYLFNMIVALEWLPTRVDLEQLQWAFRGISDLLYDVTNGAMALGQVIFGDRDWLHAADIQLMASNRLLPRSWVSGLLKDEKHMPIRAGRGVWSKRGQQAIPWNEYEAFSSLVHEWAHYALNQRDSYLATVNVLPLAAPPHPRANVLRAAPAGSAGATKLVLPQYRARAASIMATPSGSSELPNPLTIPEADRFYPQLSVPSGSFAGPNRLPLPLPYFKTVGALAGTLAEQEYRIIPPDACIEMMQANDANDPSRKITVPRLKTPRAWVYVLRNKQDQLVELIAQGTLDATSVDPAVGFRLLGAQVNDEVLIVSEESSGSATIWSGTLSGGSAQPEAVRWQTPTTVDLLPAVNIRPQLVQPASAEASRAINATEASYQPSLQRSVDIAVLGDRLNPASAAPDGPQREIAVRGGDSTLAIKVFPLGEGQVAGDPQHSFVPVRSLDGHIVIQQPGQPTVINPYSQGGGPATAPNVTTNPITAGSADGEALLFFDADTRVSDEEKRGYARVRVVTTTLPVLPLAALPGPRLSSGFGLVSNERVPAELSPTLVILVDPAAVPFDHDLFIYRLSGGAWQQLPTYVQPGGSFAAASLATPTAGGRLIEPAAEEDVTPSASPADTPARAEYYSLFAVPRS